MSFKKMCKLFACCNPRSNNRVVPTDLAAEHSVARREEVAEQSVHSAPQEAQEAPKAPAKATKKGLRNYAGTMGEAIKVLRTTPPTSQVDEEVAAPSLSA